MRIKVCGITRLEDALLCSELGVHALGFNFFPQSSRYIDWQQARAIAEALPPFVFRVGVFVNESNVCKIENIAEKTGLHALQLHGDEQPQDCAAFNSWRVIKALRIDAKVPPSEMLEAYRVSAFLLDGFKPGEYGGTGVTADWKQCAALAKKYPVILSGGLTATNVREAIAMVQPMAVDVCSGVESSPGVKDPGKLRAFMSALHGQGA